MKYLIPAASRWDLAQFCVYAFNSGQRWPKRPPTKAMRYGVAFAEVSERIARGMGFDLIEETAVKYGLTEGEEKKLALAAERVVEVLEVDDADWSAPEEPYGYSTTTGAVRRIPDGERAGDGEMYGRSDLTFFRPNARVPLTVRDFKTGNGSRGKDPAKLPQLRFLAFAAAQIYDEREVQVELALVDEPDEIKIVTGQLDALELGAVEGEIAELVDRLEAAPEPKPGPWCARCPLVTECPATIASLAAVEAELEEFPLRGPIASVEHAAHNRHRLKVLQELIEARELEVQEFARRTPLPIEGKPNTYWGLVQHDGGERIEASPATWSLLREELGDHADIAIEKDVSKASIERAIKARLAALGAKRGMLSKSKNALLEKLRASKLVKKSGGHTRFEEYTRKDAEAAE